MNKTYDPIAEYDRWEMMQEMAYLQSLKEDYCKMCVWYDDENEYEEVELKDGYGVCRLDGDVVCGREHPDYYKCDCYERF